jgi:hypothetical protein
MGLRLDGGGRQELDFDVLGWITLVKSGEGIRQSIDVPGVHSERRTTSATIYSLEKYPNLMTMVRPHGSNFQYLEARTLRDVGPRIATLADVHGTTRGNRGEVGHVQYYA